MTSNLEGLKLEYSKRIVYCKIRRTQFSKINSHEEHNEEAIKNVITNAFYREYLSRFMKRLLPCLQNISDTNKPIFDVFALSSSVFNEIILQYMKLPEYMKEVSLRNYFDDNYTSGETKEYFRDILKNYIECVSLSDTKKEIKISFRDLSYSGEVKTLVKNYELPPQLDYKIINKDLIMSLSEAEKFFGFKIRKCLRVFNKYKKDFVIIFNNETSV